MFVRAKREMIIGWVMLGMVHALSGGILELNKKLVASLQAEDPSVEFWALPLGGLL